MSQKANLFNQHNFAAQQLLTCFEVRDLARIAPVCRAWRAGFVTVFTRRMTPSFKLFEVPEAEQQAKKVAEFLIKEQLRDPKDGPFTVSGFGATLLREDGQTYLALDVGIEYLQHRVTAEPMTGAIKRVLGACRLDTGKPLACLKPRLGTPQQVVNWRKQMDTEYEFLKTVSGEPGVVRTYLRRATDSYYCILQDFCKKGDLNERLRDRDSPFPRAAKIKFMKQLGSAVSNIHGWMVTHGDIWRNNVGIADDGSPALIDFDHAKKFSDESIVQDDHQLEIFKSSVARDVRQFGRLCFELLHPSNLDIRKYEDPPYQQLPLQYRAWVENTINTPSEEVNIFLPYQTMDEALKGLEACNKPFLPWKTIVEKMGNHPLFRNLLSEEQQKLLAQELDKFRTLEEGYRLTSIEGVPCTILHGISNKDVAFLIFDATLPKNPTTHLAISLISGAIFTCATVKCSKQAFTEIADGLCEANAFSCCTGSYASHWDTASGTGYIIQDLYTMKIVQDGQETVHYNATLNSLKGFLSNAELTSIEDLLEEGRRDLKRASTRQKQIPFAAVTRDNIILHGTSGDLRIVFTEFRGKEGYDTNFKNLVYGT